MSFSKQAKWKHRSSPEHFIFKDACAWNYARKWAGRFYFISQCTRRGRIMFRHRFFLCVTTGNAYWKNFCHQIQKHRMRRLRETTRFFSFKRNTLILEAPKLRSFPKCVWVKVMSSLTAFRERFELLNNHLSPIPNCNLNDNMLSINSSLSHFEDQGMRFHPGSLRGRKKEPCS